MYGSGLRQIECLRLRVKDLGFDQGSITVHDGKGGKHRSVQDLMGHSDVETNVIYLHILRRPGAGAASPLDFPP